MKSKTNGQAAPSSLKAAELNDSGVLSSPLEVEVASEPAIGAVANVANDVANGPDSKSTGSETPDHRSEDLVAGAMEATPAGLGSEATVR